MRLRIVGVVIAAMLASGCANQSFTESGFLEDYETQQVVEGNESLRLSIDRAALARYDRVIIEPTLNTLDADTFSTEDADALAAHFTEVVSTALNECLTIVTAPEPGTLRLRAALTDFDGVSRGLNIFTSIVFFGPVDNGGATVEFALVDATNNETVVSGVGFEQGGIREIGKSFSELGHAKFALEAIADALKLELAQATDATQGAGDGSG
ncbi:MAG: DUF3313 domain-containing protein [Pseudomonadota bacterium]